MEFFARLYGGLAWIYLGLFWLTFALIIAGLAQGKDRSGLNWFILGLIFGPGALLALVIIPVPFPLNSPEITLSSTILPGPKPIDPADFAPEGIPIPDEDEDEDSPKP